jgi:hypothetical protein
MKSLFFIVVLIAVVVAGLGYYRGWFGVSTNGAGQNPSTTFTVDKNKLHEDEKKAKDEAQRLEQKAKDKIK